MRTLLYPVTIMLLLSGCGGASHADLVFDFTAIDLFWDIQTTLAADEEPTEQQWQALFDTPGYRALTASEFPVDFLYDRGLLLMDAAKLDELVDAVEEAIKATKWLGNPLNPLLDEEDQRNEVRRLWDRVDEDSDEGFVLSRCL